ASWREGVRHWEGVWQHAELGARARAQLLLVALRADVDAVEVPQHLSLERFGPLGFPFLGAGQRLEAIRAVQRRQAGAGARFDIVQVQVPLRRVPRRVEPGARERERSEPEDVNHFERRIVEEAGWPLRALRPAPEPPP